MMPAVMAVFSVEHDIEQDSTRSRSTVGNLLIDFILKLHELKKEMVQRAPEIEWIKAVQMEFELTIKTKLREEEL